VSQQAHSREQRCGAEGGRKEERKEGKKERKEEKEKGEKKKGKRGNIEKGK
jgi:hypothetical protein